MKNRLIALVLATCTVFSLLCVSGPVVGAALAPSTGADLALSYQYLPDVPQHNLYKNSLGSTLSTLVSPELIYDALEDLSASEFTHYGEVSLEELKSVQYTYNNNFFKKWVRAFDMNLTTGPRSIAEITEVPSAGILRLVDPNTNEFIVDYKGNYPFARVTGDVVASNNTVYNNQNRWVRFNSMNDFKQAVVLSETELARMCADLNYFGVDCTLHTSDGIEFILAGRNSAYANFAGKPYVALKENTVTEIVRPPITEDNIVIENNNGLVIDSNEGVLNLPTQIGDTVAAKIENLEFDLGSKFYTANVNIPVLVGGVTVNYNYTYNIQYNITNTYVTYIGSNDAYEREEYTLYYQLPDGRSSADLTADEVAGMSFEFYDVVNYERSTDEISVQGLYHFDGTTEDSSYFSGVTDGFKWGTGASLTYMDAGDPFGGALYLDERYHRFTIGLPDDIVASDFTITFRYYQASEPDTADNKENGIYVGDRVLVSWDESSLYNAFGTSLSKMGIGIWNEITFQRYGSRFNVYLNGIRLSNLSYTNLLLDDKLTFEFGSTSRAYSMIDELRVVDHALYPGQTSYTPTSVPYDSNLILVLPDAERPMADKYYYVKSARTNLLGDTFNFLEKGGSSSAFVTSAYSYENGWPLTSGKFAYDTYYPSPIVGDRYVALVGGPEKPSEIEDVWHYTTPGYLFPIVTADGFSSLQNYTFSLVHTDGTVDELSFGPSTLYDKKEGSSNQHYKTVAYKKFSWGYIVFGRMTSGKSRETTSGNKYFYQTSCIAICPFEGKEVDVAYLSLTEGATSGVELVTVTDVYDGADIKANTAAIQSVIPVRGYTVGGVRPSMPERGDCWFPVSENRITSVQIYTGSMWQEVNARWFTGSRWIPIYAFDITTLEDLFDIADSDGVVAPLPDQSSFLRWWQLQWLDFRSWLEDALSKLGAASGGTVIPEDEDLPGDPVIDGGDDGGWSFVDLVVQTKDGIWAVTKGIVRTAAGGITGLVLLIGDAGSFFEPFQEDHPEGIFGVLNYGGDDIWD